MTRATPVVARPKLDGSLRLICAPIVPFEPSGALDVAGLEALFRDLYSHGVRYVFAPGTTGEFTALSAAERTSVVRVALEIFGPDGVYAHVGAATSRQAIPLARDAYDLGARQFAAITPYFLTAGPRSVVAYYEEIAEAIPEGDLYAYVFRDRATTDVDPGTLATIAEIRGVRGAKISGLSGVALKPYIDQAPSDFLFFSGNDRELFQLPELGCAGVVSGVASVFPRLFVDAASAAGKREAGALLPSISRAVDAVAGGDLALLKAGVAMRGLPAGPLRVSLDPPREQDLEQLRRVVQELAWDR